VIVKIGEISASAVDSACNLLSLAVIFMISAIGAGLVLIVASIDVSGF
jgi:hypothetical protein